MVFKYIKKDSMVHRMEPVSKLVFLTALMVLAFMTENVLCLGFLILLPCVLFVLAKIPRAVLPNMYMLAGILLISWLLKGMGGMAPITLRLMAVFYCAKVFSLTTEPKDFAYSLERIGLPFPVVFVISTAIRIIPIMEEEIEKIKDAQASRGLDLETRNPVKRIRNSFPLLVPLLRGSIHRANEMALALESRGFRNAQFVRR